MYFSQVGKQCKVVEQDFTDKAVAPTGDDGSEDVRRFIKPDAALAQQKTFDREREVHNPSINVSESDILFEEVGLSLL